MIFFSERFDDFSVKGLGAPVISAGNTQKAGTDENCFHERKLLFEKIENTVFGRMVLLDQQ
jgi:hypothetical protein